MKTVRFKTLHAMWKGWQTKLATGSIVAALAWAVSGFVAQAQTANPPDLMTYQGYLVDANGSPLAPTTPMNFSIIFRIYATSSGGTSLWTESQTVTVDKGNFSVVLGEGGAEGSESRPALSSLFGSNNASDRYIGITVKGLSGGDSEIMPRLRLLTSPYAFLAKSANGLVAADGTSLMVPDSGRLRVSQALQTSGGNTRGDGAVDLQTLRQSSSPGMVASGKASVLSGGENNTASGSWSTVSGGTGNVASGQSSTVSGGEKNSASGNYSAIPGGLSNEASKDYTFAAGRRAKAIHAGSFVWGDGTDADKSTTGDNQFLIKASGGMAVNATPISGTSLNVSGGLKADSADISTLKVSTLTTTSVSGNGTIPINGIIIWSGASTAIPTGWALCDGQNNTPDLRGRFVLGAGAGTSLTARSVGDKGGEEKHTMTISEMPAHTHTATATVSNNGKHSHTYYSGYGSNAGIGGGSFHSGEIGYKATANTSTDNGEHNHTVTVTLDTTGSGTAFNVMPPYYVLAYIMRTQ